MDTHSVGNIENVEDIDWNHPLVRDHGICPEHLLRPLFQYADTTWNQRCEQHPACWNMNGKRWFLLASFLSDWPSKRRPDNNNEEG